MGRILGHLTASKEEFKVTCQRNKSGNSPQLQYTMGRLSHGLVVVGCSAHWENLIE